MATKRISKSVVDWAALHSKIPASQNDFYRAFKAKSDNFISRVHRYPESMPAINWAHYKSSIHAAPGLVDEFEKSMKDFTIPYPKDSSGVSAEITKEESDYAKYRQEKMAEIEKTISEYQSLKDKIDLLPPPEEWTRDMYAYYFPDRAINPDKPSFWPHTKSTQPENVPDAIN